MAYAQIDPIIFDWASKHRLQISTEFNGPARFCYLPGGWGECYQISIAPPENGEVDIVLRTVETVDDEEWEEAFVSSESGLGTTLETVIGKTEEWKKQRKHLTNAVWKKHYPRMEDKIWYFVNYCWRRRLFMTSLLLGKW